MRLIDWDQCLSIANNKPALATEMLSLFMTELPGTVEAINEACHGKEWERLRELVHRLHGGCCYIGVPELKAAAKQLEIQLTEDETPNNVDLHRFMALMQAVWTEFQMTRGLT